PVTRSTPLAPDGWTAPGEMAHRGLRLRATRAVTETTARVPVLCLTVRQVTGVSVLLQRRTRRLCRERAGPGTPGRGRGGSWSGGRHGRRFLVRPATEPRHRAPR